VLVDSHCHLDFADFDNDRDGIINSAVDAGVGFMLTICTKISGFREVLAVAKNHDNIFCSAGTHPHNVKDEPDVGVEQLIELAQHSKVIGFGETGLDFYYDHSPRELQERLFRAHIQASRETGLPVIIHTRDADKELVRILNDEFARGPFSGLIHCFSGDSDLAEFVLDKGFYISFSGIVTFKKAHEIRKVAKNMPLNRILVETDAPYLAPVPMRGKRNEPAFTAYTAEFVASLRGVDSESFFNATTNNFFELFTKAAEQAGVTRK